MSSVPLEALWTSMTLVSCRNTLATFYCAISQWIWGLSQMRVVPTTFMIKPRHLPAHSYLFSQLEIWYEMLRQIYFILLPSYFILFPALFHNLLFHSLPGLFHFISSPELFHYFARLVSFLCQSLFLAVLIYLAMMGSNSKTCDLLFASIYIFIAQLIYIMTSNANKYKDQKPGATSKYR